MLPLVADSTKLQPHQYSRAHNLRVRNGVVSTIKAPVRIMDFPIRTATKLQGHYALGSVHIVFADGFAYCKDLSDQTSDYQIIDDVQLSSTVNVVYATTVSESSFNFARSRSNDYKESEIHYTERVSGLPSGLVCQDGSSQPIVIQSNLVARRLGDYNHWTPEFPEYVPIGSLMLELNGVLYIISSDHRSIYRSVSGRPLDFMVNIRSDGSKEPLEGNGGAETVSHAVGYSPITCIGKLNANRVVFFVSTLENSWVVQPDYSALIFGEPVFNNIPVGATGAVGPFAFADINGDAAFVDTTGIRSFNAVSQDTNVGKNRPFSAAIAPFLRDIRQVASAAIEFDDYIFFSVNTVYGYGVLVFDTILDVFVSLDLYSNIGPIKQFCKVISETVYKLFFITVDNKLYEAFASGQREIAELHVGDFSSSDEKIDLHPWMIDVNILNSQDNGNFLIIPTVEKVQSIEQYSIAYKLGDNKPLTVDIARSLTGWRVGVIIKWSGVVDISSIRMISETQESIVSTDQKARAYKTLMEN